MRSITFRNDTSQITKKKRDRKFGVMKRGGLSLWREKGIGESHGRGRESCSSNGRKMIEEGRRMRKEKCGSFGGKTLSFSAKRIYRESKKTGKGMANKAIGKVLAD